MYLCGLKKSVAVYYMIRVLDFKNSKAGPRPFSSGSEGERLDFLSGVQKNDKKVGNAVFFL